MKRARPRNKKKQQLKEERQNQRAKKPKKARKVFKTIGSVMLSLLVAGLVVLGFKFVFDNNPLIQTEGGIVNVLLLGVDGDGLRTDTMIIASYDADESQLRLLSIPRDTKVYVENRKMTRKMTEIHSIREDGEILGPVGTVEAVTQLTGIPIHYYVEFSFETAEKIIDKIGPFTYDVPDVEGKGRGMNYDDPYQNLHIHLKPGVQVMNGKKTVQLMRYRKSNFGGGDGDHKRMERQQNVIKELISQKLNAGLILKIPDIFKTLQNEINTNLTLSDVIKYSKYLSTFNKENIVSYKLAGEDKMINGASYFICDMDETKKMIEENFYYDASNITDRFDITGNSETVKKLMEKAVVLEKPIETEE